MIEEALRRQLEPVVDRRQRLSLAWRLSVYWLACGLAGLALARRRPSLRVENAARRRGPGAPPSWC